MGGSADITICENDLPIVNLTMKGRIVPIVPGDIRTDNIVQGRVESGQSVGLSSTVYPMLARQYALIPQIGLSPLPVDVRQDPPSPVQHSQTIPEPHTNRRILVGVVEESPEVAGAAEAL